MTARRVAVLALAAALLTGTIEPAASAAAKPRPNPCSVAAVSATRQKIGVAVAARSAALQRLAGTLDAWTHVTADHRDVLNRLVTGEAAALSRFQLAAGRQTICRLVQLEGRQLVDDYRVYSLTLPQIYLTLAADTGAYGASQLLAAAPNLQAKQQAATALKAFTPVGDAVLALDPAGYFPDTAIALSRQYRAVKTGTTALSAALHDAQG
jgi:hypothetical protein